MLYIAFFVLGSLWGSFSNVCIYRLPNEEGVPGKKLGYYKNWKENTELWDSVILPKLEAILQEQYSYSA